MFKVVFYGLTVLMITFIKYHNHSIFFISNFFIYYSSTSVINLVITITRSLYESNVCVKSIL